MEYSNIESMSAADNDDSAVYKQIHDVAVRHGSKVIVESALEAARNSKQVRLKDEAIICSRINTMDDEPEEIKTLSLDFPTSEDDDSPQKAIELATTLMGTAIANQPKRLDLLFLGQGSPNYFFCKHCLTVLREYYQVLIKHQPPYALTTTKPIGSMLGTLILESISRSVVDSILRDEDVMTLFESLHLSLDDCTVWSHVVDRLRSLIPASELQHLRMNNCGIFGRDMVALAKTRGLRFLYLDQVRVEDYPTFVPKSTRKFDEDCLPNIKVRIHHPQLNEGHDSLWRTVDLMPKIDELSVNVQGIHPVLVVQQKIALATTPIKCLRLTANERLADPSVYAHVITTIVRHRDEEPLKHVHAEFDFVDIHNSNFDGGDETQAARMILDCALSTTHRLYSLSFRFGYPDTMILAMNVYMESLDDVPTQPGAASRLRRLDVCSEMKEWDTAPDDLQTILTFLKLHLPYVYFLGEGIRNLSNENLWKTQDGTLDQTRNLRQQILLQLERNQVGMALLHPEVYESVPPSIWPLILEKATSKSKPSASSEEMNIPVSGLFDLMKELAAREVINSYDPIQADPAIKRPKLNIQ